MREDICCVDPAILERNEITDIETEELRVEPRRKNMNNLRTPHPETQLHTVMKIEVNDTVKILSLLVDYDNQKVQ